MSAKYDFSKNLEHQLRQEVRDILANDISITSKFDSSINRWIVEIDVTEAENKLTKLALDCY